MNIQIKENVIPNLKDLIELYSNVGWNNYINNPEMLDGAYKNSLKVLSAWENDRLIGVIRVVGDGYSIIYIQDLLILDEYQHNGIGSLLLNKVIKIYDNVYQKILMTEDQPNTVGFYEKCGFRKSNEYGCVAFVNFKC